MKETRVHALNSAGKADSNAPRALARVPLVFPRIHRPICLYTCRFFAVIYIVYRCRTTSTFPGRLIAAGSIPAERV